MTLKGPPPPPGRAPLLTPVGGSSGRPSAHRIVGAEGIPAWVTAARPVPTNTPGAVSRVLVAAVGSVVGSIVGGCASAMVVLRLLEVWP